MFSPDGRTLTSVGDDGTVRFWDAATHRPLATLTDHAEPRTPQVFSHDGRTLASVGDHGTIRLWDIADDRPLATLTDHTGLVTMVAFSPNGETLAIASGDHTVRLSPLPRLWPRELCHRAGRNLTQEEWSLSFGDRPYQRLCPDFPSGPGTADAYAPVIPGPWLG
jgi:WD40 repeat protein